MLSKKHRECEEIEVFDYRRLEEICNDVKNNNHIFTGYSDFEKVLWSLMDSCVAAGYDMAKRIDDWKKS